VVSENFFVSLGVPAASGTMFRGVLDEKVGSMVVLSYGYWQSRFGGDPRIIGTTLRINDHPFVVLGVAEQGFLSSQIGWGPKLFVPFSELARLRGGTDESVSTTSTYLLARLAPGASPTQLLDEIRALAPSLPRVDSTQLRPGSFNVEPARGLTAEARGAATIVSTFLMVVVTLVLLIACANLGNLLLARATERRREIAIRTALGVSRARLIQQMLTESILLTLIGGAAGYALAWYITRAIPAVLPADAPLAFDLQPDGTVLAFAALLAVGTGLVFGLVPALRASRADLGSMLRVGGTGDGVRSRLRSAFLGAQVALALTLLIVSGLFLRGLGAAQRIDPGFDSERVVNLPVDLGLRAYAPDRARSYYEQTLERVRALGDVEGASIVGTPPLVASNSGTSVLSADAAQDDRTAMRGVTFTRATDGYFELLRLHLVAGRPLLSSDRAGAPGVAVVNESFARMMWDGVSAVGQRFRIVGETDLLTVVGVMRDIKYKTLNDADVPFMYLPLAQVPQYDLVVQARLRNDTPAARTTFRDAVLSVDPGLALGSVQSAQHAMAISLLPSRIGALLLGAFGTVALLLSTLGVYGVTAYVVGQRTHEVGIRTALGASRATVLRQLMSETLRVVLVGIGVGIATGALIGKAASSWLYGISGTDPVAFIGASVLLTLVAGVGTWLPARRALSVDPMQALRAE
jgi:predicted permease